MVIADINVGLLFMFAISSVGVYGIVLAGWSSNSKYPFLGGIRSTSQMISYELSHGPERRSRCCSSVGRAEPRRRSSTTKIANGWLLAAVHGRRPEPRASSCSGSRSSSRSSLSPSRCSRRRTACRSILPESETELVAGYHTEYSLDEVRPLLPRRIHRDDRRQRAHRRALPRRLALPFIPMAPATADLHCCTTSPAGSGASCNITTFFGKVAVLLLFFIWVRWTLPRFRFDQLMKLGWLLSLRNRAREHLPHRRHPRFHSSNAAMAYVVPRPNLTWKEKIYLPSHRRRPRDHLQASQAHARRARPRSTMQYPEEKWDAQHARALPRRADAGDGRARPRALRRLPALRVHLPAARDHDHARGDPGGRSSSPRSRSGRRNSRST